MSDEWSTAAWSVNDVNAMRAPIRFSAFDPGAFEKTVTEVEYGVSFEVQDADRDEHER